MLKTLAIAAGLAVAALPAAAEITVSDVRVTSESSSISSNALDFWPNLERDLRQKIAQGISDLADSEGWIVEVMIGNVALDGSTMLSNGAFNELTGEVAFRERGHALPRERFTLTYTAETGELGVVPENAQILDPSRTEFYDALLDAFAGGVVARIRDF